MNLSTLVFSIVAVILVGIPVTAVAVVCRDDLRHLRDGLARALAFDPRHPALSYLPTR